MNVTCHNCKTKFTIPDHRVPRDKTSILTCPKCKEKIQVPGVKQQKPFKADKGQSFHLSFEDRLNALVCINGDDFKKKVVSTVKQMGLNADAVNNTQAALKRFEYHMYHLVIVDGTFDQNRGAQSIIDRMNTIDMSLRRRICLVWINNKFNTYDNMAALHFSVNAVFNQGDILHFESFLSRVLLEHKQFYTVYNESLKLAGKI